MESPYSRSGYKWSVNEILSLQREFELLGWDINKIASKHKRSPDAIMYKLDQEGLADYNVLYSNYHDLNATMPVTRKHKVTAKYCNDDDTASLSSEENDVDEEYIDDGEEYDDDDDDDDYDYEEDNVANLSQRVEGLEEGISEIRNMIKQMMETISKKPSCSVSCH